MDLSLACIRCTFHSMWLIGLFDVTQLYRCISIGLSLPTFHTTVPVIGLCFKVQLRIVFLFLCQRREEKKNGDHQPVG